MNTSVSQRPLEANIPPAVWLGLGSSGDGFYLPVYPPPVSAPRRFPLGLLSFKRHLAGFPRSAGNIVCYGGAGNSRQTP